MKKQELESLVQECIAEVLDEKYSEFQRVDKGKKDVVAKDKGEEDVYGAGYAAGERAAKKKYKKLAEAYMALSSKKPIKEDIFDDIESDMMEGGFESQEAQIAYLKEIISFCQSKINEIESNLNEADGKIKENIFNTPQMGGVTKSKGTAGYTDNTSKMDKDYADSVKGEKSSGGYNPKERAAKAKYKKLAEAYKKLKEDAQKIEEDYDGGPEDLAAMAKSSNALRNKPETKELAKKASEQAKSKDEAADMAVKLAKAKGIKDSEQITHIVDLAVSMFKK